jgi:hypothetical protein
MGYMAKEPNTNVVSMAYLECRVALHLKACVSMVEQSWGHWTERELAYDLKVSLCVLFFEHIQMYYCAHTQ